MKITVIRMGVCLLSLALGAHASAQTSIRSLITGSGGQITVSPGAFIVSKRTSDLKTLLVGIGYSQASVPGRLDGVTVYVLKEYLTPAEFALFSKAVQQVAATCFNLLPARLPAIDTWLDTLNRSRLETVRFSFGPMMANYGRSISEDGDYQTSVTMFRAGSPGTAPWTRHCTP